MCCELDSSMEAWTPVWSLQIAPGVSGVPPGQTLLSSDAHEVSVLLNQGDWKEICNGIGPSGMVICVDGSLMNTAQALQGPFLVRDLPKPASNDRVLPDAFRQTPSMRIGEDHAVRVRTNATGGSWLATRSDSVIPGTFKPDPVPIYRCMDASKRHFISNNAQCDGIGTFDTFIGWGDKARSSSTPRKLIRCKLPGAGPNAGWTHTLDGACPSGATESPATIAFVH